jgi:hypothetical protein
MTLNGSGGSDCDEDHRRPWTGVFSAKAKTNMRARLRQDWITADGYCSEEQERLFAPYEMQMKNEE